MNLIIGAVVVVVSVIAGFTLSGGHLLAIWQPKELLIILGAAGGGMIIANPFSVLKQVVANIPAMLKGPPYSKSDYLLLFGLLPSAGKCQPRRAAHLGITCSWAVCCLPCCLPSTVAPWWCGAALVRALPRSS